MAIVKTLIVKGVARFLTDAYMSTIRSGIWNGSTIQVGYGGTGVTSAKGNQYTPVFLASNGITPCSVEIPHATKDFKINGVTYAVFTNSTGAAPTIFAPTTLAGTGGYILATNAAKTGLEWVAKPATNVTTSAVVASSASGTTQITAAQVNPFYNLLEGGVVTRSIQFTSSNITVSSTTGGVISFTAASWAGATSEAAGTAGYMPGAAVADRTKFLRGDGSWIALSQTDHTHSVKINGSTKTIAAPGGTAVDLGSYVLLDAGATEQTIKNSIGSLSKGSIEIWRAVASGYAMIGFANGTTKTSMGMLGFAEANKPIFRNTSGTNYLIAHAGNITVPSDTSVTWNTEKTIATIAGVTVKIKIPANPDRRKAFYGTCDTAAATAAKVVTLSNTDGWVLVAGTIIGVKFTNSNTASSVTLAVNGEAAKSIFYDNAAYTGSSTDVCGKADRLVYYMYDGTYWVYIGNSYIINTTYSAGTAALIQAGTNTTNRVWQAKILQDEFVSKRGDTMTGTLVMKTDGTTSSSYNQGIRINRTGTNKWAVLLIGKSGDAVTGTGTSTAGDGAWLIGTPASSNSLVFCLNDYSNENSGMCLKGNGTNDFKWRGNTVAHAGNISSEDATISTSLTKIATIAGVEIKAKIPDVTAQAIQLVSVEKTLAVSTWTDMAAISTYSGTYAIQISDGTLYASGTFSVCGGTDAIIDEIPLHVSSTGATWRPYARISAGQLQMTTNEATGTARTYTIKILKLI